MKRAIIAAFAAIIMGSAAYADTIKIGVVGPFSGPFALQGKNFKAGIDAYIALHGATVGDDTVEIVYRDLPAADTRSIQGFGAGTGGQEKGPISRGVLLHPRCDGRHADPSTGQCSADRHECRDNRQS